MRVFTMLWLVLISYSLVLAQDVNPDKLSTFSLDTSPKLVHFKRVKDPSYRAPTALTGNTAQLRARYFCGQTEITYSVHLFATTQATDSFLKFEKEHSQVGFSGRSPDRAVSADKSSTGWRCAVVNRVVIELRGANYAKSSPWIRKNNSTNLTDAELDQLLTALKKELVDKAKKFELNQG